MARLVLCLCCAVFGGAACGTAGPQETPHTLPIPLPAESSAAAGPAWFGDVTSAAGIQFTYDNGEDADQYAILETLGGGVGLIDFDRDGRLDVFLTGGGSFAGPDKRQIVGRPSKLFRNLGDWKFVDVTQEVGLAEVDWWYTHGAAVADYDCDGWPDLLVTGYGRLALFQNQAGSEGQRRFVDVSAKVGLHDDRWCTSAAWADLDGDFFPDLYVCHYSDWSMEKHVPCPGIVPQAEKEICGPHRFEPQAHALFHNKGGQSFENLAGEFQFPATGFGLGVVAVDLNGDAQPDLCVANDMTPNFLYFNRRGKLQEAAVAAGVALDERGRRNGNMGIDAADYDGSGRASLWITVFQNETHALSQNLGNEVFLPQSRAAGIARIGQHFVGFGTGFLDADNDGHEDLVFVAGHVYRKPPGDNRLQRPVLLHNESFRDRRTFTDLQGQAGEYFQKPAIGRGLAIGDLDNDGWADIIVSHSNTPVAVLRNQVKENLSTPRHWIGLELMGRDHRDIVGSTIVVESEGRTLTHFAKGGGSYLSSSDRRILCGLGEAERVQKVTVKWSWGESQVWENLDSDRYWQLREGEAAAGSR